MVLPKEAFFFLILNFRVLLLYKRLDQVFFTQVGKGTTTEIHDVS